MKRVWCAPLAVSLLTANNTLRGEMASVSQTNVRTASGSSVLSTNTAAGSTNTSVPASAGGSRQSQTGTIRGSEANASNSVGTKAVASDTTSSVGNSASGRPVANAISPSQSSNVPSQTAPTGTSNGVPASTGSATVSNATVATTSSATTSTATGATVPANPITGATASATGTAPTADVAGSSQTSPVLANISLNATPSGTNSNPPTTEEEEPQDLGDILDLRPPAKLKVSLLPWIIALLSVLSAVGLWFLLKRKRRGKTKKEKPTKPIDPYAEVLQALKEASQKLDVNNPKPFAFFLTDAVRLYLSRIFRLPAPESTTQELLQQLPWCVELTDDLRTNITQFLQRCDLVKFTTMPFDEPFLTQLYQQAETIVAASHELTKPKPAPVASAAPNAASSPEPEKTSKK